MKEKHTLTQKDIKNIIAYAKRFLGTPYARGSREDNQLTFDCSSFIQHIFGKFGLTLPRSTVMQASYPKGIALYPSANTHYKLGDVLFMRSDRGFYFDEAFGGRKISIGHVALYIGNGKIIHSQKSKGGVVIESLKELQKDKNYQTVLLRRYTREHPIYKVPTHSQYTEISDPYWKQHTCGIVSLGMILKFYKKKFGSLDDLLKKGIRMHAYKKGVGWIHAGIVRLANKYKLYGEAFDWKADASDEAFIKLIAILNQGPCIGIVSIHKDFNRENDGHLIVLTGYRNGEIHYNEPATKKGEKIKRTIAKEKFIAGWKQRAIFVHP